MKKLKARLLPTLKQVEIAIKIPAVEWEGRCFEIAYAIVKAGLVAGHAVYGHWRGPIATSSMFYKKNAFGFVQHGWVLLDDKNILDPTRWAFEGCKPYLWCGPGNSPEYDEGGNRFRLTTLGPAPVFNSDDVIVEMTKRVMPDSAAFTFVEKLLRLRTDYTGIVPPEPGEMTREQLHWLARMPPDLLKPHTAAVYAAIRALGMHALIPIDNVRKVERETVKKEVGA